MKEVVTLKLMCEINDKLREAQDRKIEDLMSTINLQRATIEGLKSGRYVAERRQMGDYN